MKTATQTKKLGRVLPVFVYGTLKEGHGNHRVIGWATDRVVQAELDGALMHDLGPYPAAVPGTGSIRGELVYLDPQELAPAMVGLDQLEGVAFGLYRREMVTVTTVHGIDVDAWVYWYSQDLRGAPVVASGDWTKGGPR